MDGMKFDILCINSFVLKAQKKEYFIMYIEYDSAMISFFFALLVILIYLSFTTL
jgi:hypothetical protein